jgi:magnesium transporter
LSTALRPIGLDNAITDHLHHDFASLQVDLTVGEALAVIREKGLGEQIIYFYVVDRDERLVGVVPTRRLLTMPLDKPLSEIMVTSVVVIPQSATVLEACEFFVLHRLLAFPVVDTKRRVVGIADVHVFTDELLDLAEREQSDALFEALGFRIAQVRDASPLKAFRVRFPWLLATIVSGTFCAMLTSRFELTLAKSLILAFFMTLVLGLGESVSIQSMTVSIQSLRVNRPTRKWYFAAIKREAMTASLLGLGCGAVVGLIVLGWRGELLPALVVGCGIFLSLISACLFGLSVPALLHALRLDPRIAAGPITLGLADVMTLLFYFSLAKVIL